MKTIRLNDTRSQVALHSIVWAIIFALPFLLYNNHNNVPRNRIPPDEMHITLLNFISCFIWVGLFYFNGFVLVKKFFYPNRYLPYFLALLASFAFVLGIHAILFRWLIGDDGFNLFNATRFNLPTFLLTVAVSITWKLSVDRVHIEKTALQKQEENLKTELSFLRSQISPHFIFNVLNNIVALVRMKSDELEPTVMKLSSLMQYMLYKTNEETVLLKTETEYLNSYIDLQMQRFGKKVKVTTRTGRINAWSEIEPMLLIPFVENAFKHGVGFIINPQIDIDLEVSDTNELIFTVRNKKSNVINEVRDKTSGIGLVNVKRRLNLLYKNNHDLEIKQEEEWFSVLLKIKLHE